MTLRAPDGDLVSYRVPTSETASKMAVGDEVVIEEMRPLLAAATAAPSASPGMADGDRLVRPTARAAGGTTRERATSGTMTTISRAHEPSAVIASHAERCPAR